MDNNQHSKASDKVTPRFSFSRLDAYGQCGYGYRLKYVEGHYVDDSSVATEFGTLCHHIYERIGAILIAGGKPDYDQLRREFHAINVPKKGPRDVEGGIYGIDILQEKYKDEFFDANNKDHMSYGDKSRVFLGNEEEGTGMFSLERYLRDHPSYRIKAVEQLFDVKYRGFEFYGYIDRILYDRDADEYIIEDIKTKGHEFSSYQLPDATLQLAIYAMAVKNMYNLPAVPTKFAYDLPFVGPRGERQVVGSYPGWYTREIKKLDKRLDDITAKVFDPKPSKLCYWCPYCGMNPKQPKEAKFLCPYYAIYKPSPEGDQQNGQSWGKIAVLNEWQGWDSHEMVMDHYLHDQCGLPRVVDKYDFDY